MWTVCSAATVYKWVDANGVTHYSDQPHPGAEQVEVGTPQTYSAPPPPPARAPSRPAARQEQADSYSMCEITRPSNDEVIFNDFSVTVMVRVMPELRAGHTLSVAMDGKRLPQTVVPDAGFTINPVYRGTHTLVAVIEDATGRELCRSSTITFHVRQPSRLAPNPANRPRF
ncbi:MAG TPA: DUF4124 domain-containing protein [Steroidobacteraceae bacterium]